MATNRRPSERKSADAAGAIITTMILVRTSCADNQSRATERAGFTYFPARGVVAAPFFERTSAGLQRECGPAILRHERHGPENNLRLPQIRVLFPRLPAARKKDGGQDSWLGWLPESLTRRVVVRPFAPLSRGLPASVRNGGRLPRDDHPVALERGGDS